ncbi:MAG: transposase [Deltaproteobacteria bacterium]|nr:transposase [Deltaproteobacteria bacterium]
MTRSRYRIISSSNPYFLTCTVVNWITLFNDPKTVQIILDSWSFLQDHDRLRLYGYVVLDNHVHFIADSSDLVKEVGNFKSFTASRILDRLQKEGRQFLLDQLRRGKEKHKQDRTYQVWQEGSHPEMVFSEDVLLKKLQYMHYNPVRRGYVDDPMHWRYSSAGDYSGKSGLLKLKGMDLR